MDQQEVAEYYATVTGPLLTAIRDAARIVVPPYKDKGVELHETGQDRDGRALATGHLVITRAGPNDSIWTIDIGFGSGQAFYDAIDLDVPKGQFPPMRVPTELMWLGNDRWGRRKNAELIVPPFELSRDSIAWLGRRWSKASDLDAQWIVTTILERWLLHDSPEAAEEARLQEPAARWERVERIGGWGPGEVLRVRDLRDPTAPHRAMKVLRWRKGPGTTVYKRLLREIEITRQLGQENSGIVEVIDFGIPQDGDEWTPFYVMPLAESTLAKATDFAGNLEAVLSLGIKLAAALAAAHEKGVIHRDVKPDNVLLFGPERRPVVADFGICFLATEEGSRLTGDEAKTVGPANYVAPELLGGKAESAAIDARVDVYSLGKTMYYALAGGEDLPREYHTQDRYDLRKKLDDPRIAHFYGLLQRMVVEDPKRRFPTMRACGEAFARALANIKKYVPYADGMYGGTLTPVERFEQFTHTLTVASGLPRKDGVRNAITESRQVVDALVAELAAPGGRPPPQDQMTRVSAEAAESLMAAGLPLVTAGESEGFERWLDDIVAPLGPDGTGGMAPASNVKRAASVLAFHGVAAAAWYGERLALLGMMLKKYDKHSSAFVYLRICNGEATATWEWIAKALKGSSVLSRAEPTLERDLDEALVLVAGLGALVSLLDTSPAALAAAVPEQGDLDIVLFPAFAPQACLWVESLPALFTHAPAVERAVAQEVFGSTPEVLRENCKRITPRLARILGWTASQLGRATMWIEEIPRGGSWSKWCGGEVEARFLRG